MLREEILLCCLSVGLSLSAPFCIPLYANPPNRSANHSVNWLFSFWPLNCHALWPSRLTTTKSFRGYLFAFWLWARSHWVEFCLKKVQERSNLGCFITLLSTFRITLQQLCPMRTVQLDLEKFIENWIWRSACFHEKKLRSLDMKGIQKLHENCIL